MMKNNNHVRNAKGFTLIELLIVIGIIGILTAIIVPALSSSIRKANEASAVTTLNAIKVAEAKYALDRNGHYGTFKQLFDEAYLDKRFNSEKPEIKGYFFVLTLVPKSEGKVASYAVNANPVQSQGVGAKGKSFYYVDPNSGICIGYEGPATAADDLL
jgi:prepilin-type N-terminal cleavage/methylation domain-containing protein